VPALTLLTALTLAIGLLPVRFPAAGFWWDWLAGLGFCGLAMIAYLGWDSESPATSPRLRLHRNIALLATILTGVHATGYLIDDLILIEYLKPTAPPYMLLGIAAFTVMVGTTITALPAPRQYFYTGFSSFRNWHRWLVALVLIGSIWHVIGTDFTITTPMQTGFLILLTLLLPAGAFCARRLRVKLPLTTAPDSERRADNNTVALALLMLLFAGVYSAIKNLP